MRDEKPFKKLEGSSIIWDNSSIAEPANGYCIRATPDEFDAVATYLLSSVALRYPDPDKIDDTGIENFNEFLRNAAQRIALQMMSRMIICGLEAGMRLRQKVGSPFVMQQEQSDNVWVDVFDYGVLCECITDAVGGIATGDEALVIINNAPTTASNIYNTYTNNYTGTSASYDPSLVISGAGAGAARGALCKVIREIIANKAAAGLKIKNEQLDGLDRASIAIAVGIGVVAVIGAIAAIPSLGASIPAAGSIITALGGAGYVALGGSVAGLTGTGLAVWSRAVKDTELPVFQDTAAADALACAWYNHLKNETDISKEKFQESFPLPSGNANVEPLYNAVKDLLAEELTYATFLKDWKTDLNMINNAGADEDCGCEAEIVLIQQYGPSDATVYEGPTSEGDIYVIKAFHTGNAATYYAISQGNIPFYLVDWEVIYGDDSFGSIVLNGYYPLDKSLSGWQDVPLTGVGIYGNEGVHIRLTLIPA